MNEKTQRMMANVDFGLGDNPDNVLRREVGRLLSECGWRVATGEMDMPATIYLRMESQNHSTRLVLDAIPWPKEVKT